MAPMLSALGAGRRRPWQLVWQRAESRQNHCLAGFAQARGRRRGKPKAVTRLATLGGELKQDGGRAPAIHSFVIADSEV
jgi:hypothetical protein